jgi:hypothetical protein
MSSLVTVSFAADVWLLKEFKDGGWYSGCRTAALLTETRRDLAAVIPSEGVGGS